MRCPWKTRAAQTLLLRRVHRPPTPTKMWSRHRTDASGTMGPMGGRIQAAGLAESQSQPQTAAATGLHPQTTNCACRLWHPSISVRPRFRKYHSMYRYMYEYRNPNLNPMPIRPHDQPKPRHTTSKNGRVYMKRRRLIPLGQGMRCLPVPMHQNPIAAVCCRKNTRWLQKWASYCVLKLNTPVKRR